MLKVVVVLELVFQVVVVDLLVDQVVTKVVVVLELVAKVVVVNWLVDQVVVVV